MENALGNEGVDNHNSFHAKEFDDNRKILIWDQCEKLAQEDLEGMIDDGNHQS